MGDGASWIKAFATDGTSKFHPDIQIKYGLDKFHMTQALMSMSTKKYKDSYYAIMKNYVITNKKEEFINVVESLIYKDPKREEAIKEKMNYILNNWEHIQTSYHDIKYKCSMESNISHALADLFTARPRAYSKKGLELLLNIRLLKINGYDLKKIYFESLKKEINFLSDQEIITRNISKSKYAKYRTILIIL